MKSVAIGFDRPDLHDLALVDVLTSSSWAERPQLDGGNGLSRSAASHSGAAGSAKKKTRMAKYALSGGPASGYLSWRRPRRGSRHGALR